MSFLYYSRLEMSQLICSKEIRYGILYGYSRLTCIIKLLLEEETFVYICWHEDIGGKRKGRRRMEEGTPALYWTNENQGTGGLWRVIHLLALSFVSPAPLPPTLQILCLFLGRAQRMWRRMRAISPLPQIINPSAYIHMYRIQRILPP